MKLKTLRENKKLLRVLIIVAACALLVALGLWLVPKIKSWRESLVKARLEEQKKAQEEQEKRSQKERKVPVRAFKVARQDFRDILPILGTVRGTTEIDLKFGLSGTLRELYFKEGEVVKKGEIIAKLDQKDGLLKVSFNEARLKAAEATLEASQRKVEIHEDLFRIGAILESRLSEVRLERDSARYQAESAQAELDSARSELDKTLLYAPQDGVIGKRDAEVGEFVTPNDRVATLMDIHEVQVEVGIIERDINKIALGQGASITVDAYPQKQFSGVIDNIFPVVEGESRTLTAKIRIANDSQAEPLLPGMFARVQVNLAEFEKALLVPSVSVSDTDHDGVFDSVYLIDDEDVVHLKQVKVQYDKATDYWVIAEGVQEGELVVVEPPENLQDGTKVQVVEVQEGTT